APLAPTPFPYTTLFRSGVGEGHDRATVEPPADRLEVVADRELGDDAVLRRVDEAKAEQLGETTLVMRGQGSRIDRHGALLSQTRSEEHTSELQSRSDLV